MNKSVVWVELDSNIDMILAGYDGEGVDTYHIEPNGKVGSLLSENSKVYMCGNPLSPVFDRSGRFAYTSEYNEYKGSSSISQFSIDLSGVIHMLAEPEYTFPGQVQRQIAAN